MGILGDKGINFALPSKESMSAIGMTVLTWTLGVIAVIALLWWGIVYFRNKKIYTTPVIVLKRVGLNFKKVSGLKGGLVPGSSGVKDFMIKIPGSFRKKNLGYIPEFSFADADGSLTFIQEGDGAIWQQCKEKLITTIVEKGEDGKEQTYSLLIEPIPTDVKTVTYNNMMGVRSLIDAKKLTAFGITIIGFIIMVIAHLVSLWIQTKIRCGTP